MSFFQALAEQSFLQWALVAGLLAALSSGVVGTLVVLIRLTFMAGGIAHAVLGGMGVAHWLGYSPLGGAAVAAVMAALAVGWISRKGGEREDMLIGALWAVGMAVGIVAIAHTPGYSTDLMSYLLGNLLMVSPEHVSWMLMLNAVIVLTLLLLWRPIVASIFDEEFARLRGIPTFAIELALLVIVALCVVLLVQAVGLVLVMALITLPAATALLLSSSLARIMAIATLLAAAEIVFGLGLAFETDSPAGAVIVLACAAVYLVVLAIQRLRSH
jgi:zinc transport system permease protein